MERKESRDWKLITVDSAIGPFLIIGFGFTFCLDFYIRLDGIFFSESKWWTNTFSQSYFIWRHKYGKQVSSLFFQCIFSHRIVLLFFFEMENYSQLQCKAFNRSAKLNTASHSKHWDNLANDTFVFRKLKTTNVFAVVHHFPSVMIHGPKPPKIWHKMHTLFYVS